MNDSIRKTLKKSKVIYGSYVFAVKVKNIIKNTIVNLYLDRLPIDNNKMVFVSYYGEAYCDNPKCVCDELLKRNLNYDIVWLLKDGIEVPEGVRTVPYWSVRAQKELATAKVWVSNIRHFPRPKKKKGQVYLQTWHGIYVLKLIEGEAPDKIGGDYLKCAKIDGQISDGIIAGDESISKCMKKYFWLNEKTELLEIGEPRIDVFFDEEYKSKVTADVRKILKIKEDAQVVLFMPTFRNDKTFEYLKLDYEKIIKAFEEKYNKRTYLLVRLHPNAMSHEFSLPNSDKIINVTNYSDGFDLMIAADYLISDFSTVIINFAILNKPVFLFAPDYDEYIKNRGVNRIYFDLPLQIKKSNEELINEISSFDKNKQMVLWKGFFNKYKSFNDGHASERAVDWLLGKLK